MKPPADPTSQDARDRTRREAAEQDLARVHRDSAPILDSAMRRGADFFAARDAGSDPAEIWGRRIGRILAVAGGIGCLIYLFMAYGR